MILGLRRCFHAAAWPTNDGANLSCPIRKLLQTTGLACLLIKRSFSLLGHRTSVALELEFWAALERIAATRGMTLSVLVAEIDSERLVGSPLASRLRVTALLGGSR